MQVDTNFIRNMLYMHSQVNLWINDTHIPKLMCELISTCKWTYVYQKKAGQTPSKAKQDSYSL